MNITGKNFLRPGQMNINVATWGRLMKRALPHECRENATALSPASQISSPGTVLFSTIFINNRQGNNTKMIEIQETVEYMSMYEVYKIIIKNHLKHILMCMLFLYYEKRQTL